MNINIKGKECELKYTFGSFKYMGDLNFNDFQDVEDKPFKMIPLVETLLLGAVNHSPKVKFSLEDVEEFLDEYVVENSLGDLIEELMKLMEESNFFKSLQKNPIPAEKKKK